MYSMKEDQYNEEAMEMLQNIRNRMLQLKEDERASNMVEHSKVRKTPMVVLEYRARTHARRFITEEELPKSLEDELTSKLLPIIETIENL